MTRHDTVGLTGSFAALAIVRDVVWIRIDGDASRSEAHPASVCSKCTSDVTQPQKLAPFLSGSL